MDVLWILLGLLALWGGLYPLPDLLGRRLQLNALLGDGRDPEVALTYDVDSAAEWGAVLDDLGAAGIPAALFVSGRLAEAEPELVRRTRAAGHVLGLRGYSGRAPGTLLPWSAWADLRRGRDAVARALGTAPRWYRPAGDRESLVSTWAPAFLGLARALGQVRVTRSDPDPAGRIRRFAFPGLVLRVDAGVSRPGLAQEVREELARLGMSLAPLDRLRPEWSFVRRGWFWWEGEFTRRYGVETLPAHDGGPPIFRIGVARYHGRTLVGDGRVYPPGTPLAELHFVNQTLGRDSAAPTRAVHTWARLRRAFADAARAVRDDPRYRDCVLVGGVTVLDIGDAIGRLGLNRTPAAGFRMALMRVYLVFLMAVFHRGGFRVFRRFRRLRPVWVWLPRDAFVARFAPDEKQPGPKHAPRPLRATMGARRISRRPDAGARMPGRVAMELKNAVTMHAPREQVFRVMTEPEHLLKTMPGLKSLTPGDDGVYQAVLEIGVAAVRGRYQGTMRMVASDPPNAYRLQMEGRGPGTFVKLDLGVQLEAPEAGTTTVRYQGDAQVGGTLAGVGQRMLAGVASMIMGQFLKAVDREAQALARA